MSREIHPEDIDFPVSETFAGGLAQLHHWPEPVRCESLREARYREDSERVQGIRKEMEAYEGDTDWIKKLYSRVHGLEKRFSDVERENRMLNVRLEKQMKLNERRRGK